MSQINFIEQFNLFMEYARENVMHGRECMLWMSLFYFANRKAQYNELSQTYEWPDDFFSVSNGELNSYGQFDKRAIETLRNSLKQRGLIDFIKGDRNKKNPLYKINYLARIGCKIVPNSTPSDAPNNTSNSAPNNVSNNVPNNTPAVYPTSGILGAKTPPAYPHYINKNTGLNVSVNDDSARARARRRQSGLIDLDAYESNGTDGLVPALNQEWGGSGNT